MVTLFSIVGGMVFIVLLCLLVLFLYVEISEWCLMRYCKKNFGFVESVDAIAKEAENVKEKPDN